MTSSRPLRPTAAVLLSLALAGSLRIALANANNNQIRNSSTSASWSTVWTEASTSGSWAAPAAMGDSSASWSRVVNSTNDTSTPRPASGSWADASVPIVAASASWAGSSSSGDPDAFANGTRCSPATHIDDESINHFTAGHNASGCLGVLGASQPCNISVSAGYGGGALVCNGTAYIATASIACAAGTYSTGGGAGPCVVCPAGSVAEAGAGTGVVNSTATTCTACAAGLYSNASTAACTSCAAGSITNTGTAGGATTCTPCAAGQYSVESNVTTCSACAPGSVTSRLNLTGSSSCIACRPGQYSQSSQIACAVCPAGSVAEAGAGTGIVNSTATTCTACAAGLYSNASTTACTSCAAGSITNTGTAGGATTCTPCAAGQYSVESNVTICSACAPGSITDVGPATGASACTPCAAGFYSAESNVTACEPACIAGSGASPGYVVSGNSTATIVSRLGAISCAVGYALANATSPAAAACVANSTFVYSGCERTCIAGSGNRTSYRIASAAATTVGGLGSVECDTSIPYSSVVQATCPVIGGTFEFSGCVEGCTNPAAHNYNSRATFEASNSTCAHFVVATSSSRSVTADVPVTIVVTQDWGGFAASPSDFSVLVNRTAYPSVITTTAGSFLVSVRLLYAANHRVSVLFNGVEIANSPNTVAVLPGLPSVTGSAIISAPPAELTAAANVTVQATVRDVGHNLVHISSSSFPVDFTVNGPFLVNLYTSSSQPGIMLTNFACFFAGLHEFRATIGGVHIRGSPFSLVVVPAAISASQSSLSSGPATGNAVAGAAAIYDVVAKDAFGNVRSQPNDQFNFNVRAIHSPHVNGVSTWDLIAGVHKVTVQLFLVNAYVVHVHHMAEAVGGSPRQLTIVAGAVSAPASTVSGSGTIGAVLQVQTYFTITLRDAYGNVARSTMQQPSVAVISRAQQTAAPVSIVDLGSGQHKATYNVSSGTAGNWTLEITLNGFNVASSPYTLQVLADTGPVVAAACQVDSPAGVAGKDLNVTIHTNNYLGLPTRDAGLTIQVQMVGPSGSIFHANATYIESNIYVATFLFTLAETYATSIQVNGTMVENVSVATIIGGPTHRLVVNHTNLSTTITAGTRSIFHFIALDAFMNAANPALHSIQAVVISTPAPMAQSSVIIRRVVANHYTATLSHLPVGSNFVHIHAGVANATVNYTVSYAAAPIAGPAQFTSSGSALLVSFDVATNQAGNAVGQPLLCSAVLSCNGCSFGTRSYCTWRSSKELWIYTGHDATVKLENYLTLVNSNILTAAHNSFPAAGLLRVAAPSQLLIPDLRLTYARNQSNVCDNLVIDAAGSLGNGGRPMRFSYTLSGPPGIGIASTLASQQHGSVLTLDRSGLLPGMYSVAVSATNFLGQSSTISAIFHRSEQLIPRLMFPSGNAVVVASGEQNWLRAQASAPCVSTTFSMQFAWSQVSGPPVAPAAMARTRASSALYIPPSTLLPSQSYSFQLAVVLQAPNLAFSISAAVTVHVEARRLAVVIAGGDRSVSTAHNVTLQALVEAESPQQVGVDNKWFCSVEGNPTQPCFYGSVPQTPFGNGASQTIPARKLLYGRSYRIYVATQAGLQRAMTSVLITVVSGSLPTVRARMRPVGNPINVGEPVTFLGGALPTSMSAVTMQYTWSLSHGSNSWVNVGHSPQVSLPPNWLRPGLTYTARLQAAEHGSIQMGVASLTFTTNSPPSSGTFQVMKTGHLYALRAENWADDHQPLEYSFGTIGNAGLDEPLTPPLKSNVAWLPLFSRIGNSTVLYVDVCDALHACVRQVMTVQIADSVVNLDDVRNAIASQNFPSFTAYSKKLLWDSANSGAGRRLQATQGIDVLLSGSSTLMSNSVAHSFDIVQWAVLFVNIAQASTLSDGQAANLYQLALANVRDARQAGLKEAGAYACANFAASLVTAPVAHQMVCATTAVALPVAHYLEAMAVAQLSLSTGPNFVTVAQLETMSTHYPASGRLPALSVYGPLMAPNASVASVTLSGSGWDSLRQLLSGIDILVTQWRRSVPLSCADAYTTGDKYASDVVGVSVLSAQTTRQLNTALSVTFYMPLTTTAVAPGTVFSCQTFVDSGEWSTRHCTLQSVNASAAVCLCAQPPRFLAIRTVLSQCSSYTDCGTCLQDTRCGWCNSRSVCIEGSGEQSFDNQVCPAGSASLSPVPTRTGSAWYYRGATGTAGCPCTRSGNPACSGHGQCQASGLCTCDLRYGLQPTCSLHDHCSSNPCKNGATCVNQPTTFACTCGRGWSGNTCESQIDPCSSAALNNCDMHATCIFAMNTFSCACNTGYRGSGTSCQDIDECASMPCRNQGTCRQTAAPGGYSCNCPTGTDGVNCEIDKDECASNPCQNSGACLESRRDRSIAFGDKKCACDSRFFGDICTNAIPPPPPAAASKSGWQKLDSWEQAFIIVLVCTVGIMIVGGTVFSISRNSRQMQGSGGTQSVQKIPNALASLFEKSGLEPRPSREVAARWPDVEVPADVDDQSLGDQASKLDLSMLDPSIAASDYAGSESSRVQSAADVSDSEWADGPETAKVLLEQAKQQMGLRNFEAACQLLDKSAMRVTLTTLSDPALAAHDVIGECRMLKISALLHMERNHLQAVPTNPATLRQIATISSCLTDQIEQTTPRSTKNRAIQEMLADAVTWAPQLQDRRHEASIGHIAGLVAVGSGQFSAAKSGIRSAGVTFRDEKFPHDESRVLMSLAVLYIMGGDDKGRTKWVEGRPCGGDAEGHTKGLKCARRATRLAMLPNPARPRQSSIASSTAVAAGPRATQQVVFTPASTRYSIGVPISTPPRPTTVRSGSTTPERSALHPVPGRTTSSAAFRALALLAATQRTRDGNSSIVI